MNLATKAKVTLTAVALAGLEGLHEFHYVVSHANTIIPMAAAGVGIGAIWMGSSVKGAIGHARQAKQVDQTPAPQALPQGQPTATEAQAYLLGMREALLAKQAEPAAPQRQTIDLGRAN